MKAANPPAVRRIPSGRRRAVRRAGLVRRNIRQAGAPNNRRREAGADSTNAAPCAGHAYSMCQPYNSSDAADSRSGRVTPTTTTANAPTSAAIATVPERARAASTTVSGQHMRERGVGAIRPVFRGARRASPGRSSGAATSRLYCTMTARRPAARRSDCRLHRFAPGPFDSRQIRATRAGTGTGHWHTMATEPGMICTIHGTRTIQPSITRRNAHTGHRQAARAGHVRCTLC